MAAKGTVSIGVVRLDHGQGLPLPDYATDASSGMDLISAVDAEEPVSLAPGAFAAIPTGICAEIPEGFEAQVRPRSGLARKSGVTTLNAPGTIDADYRGEIHVILINHGAEPFEITRGLRIAQLVIAPVTKAVWVEADELTSTARGAGGFGSTGMRSDG